MTTAGAPEIVVDLAAIRHNVGELIRVARGAQVMVVVKADGYGHGMVEVAREARIAGATWIGVATAAEAVELRRNGDRGPLLCWLTCPGAETDVAAALAAGVDVTAYGVEELDDLDALIARDQQPARIQLKVDTGLTRGGASPRDWPEVVARARDLEERGRITVTGIWSHFACSDEPDHPANDQQEHTFREALAIAEAAGLRPEVRHLANSAATLLRPSARFDLVRCGLATYGLDPAPGHYPPEVDLRPAMTATAPLVLTKRIDAGAGVSYGHTWHAEAETTVGLVPVGYGDGILRHASNVAQVWLDGARRPIRGRVCMDQFVVDLGGEMPKRGADVVIFGPGTHGEPTAQEWAHVCRTISYEIVTRIGGRFIRRFRNATERRL